MLGGDSSPGWVIFIDILLMMGGDSSAACVMLVDILVMMLVILLLEI